MRTLQRIAEQQRRNAASDARRPPLLGWLHLAVHAAAGHATQCLLLRRAEVSRAPLSLHQLLLRGDALGELDHPDADSPYFKRINFKNASHRVLDLWWQGNDLHATVQVLNTRQGNLVRDTYLAGSKCALLASCATSRG